ncbi:VWA domain-containing protein [Bacteroidales bacterium OttesenSCG-928-L03]|nr:VWA domain-containing protein [Bacteroidales bacterium OttesenSCG-928-L03]
MVFADPIYFLLLLLLVPMIGWYIWKQRKADPTLQVTSSKGFNKAPKTLRLYLRHAPFVFRVLAVIFLVIAMARPQDTNKWNSSSIEGIDIVLALDVSTSMMARDLKPDRFEASKKVAASFISSRPNDNIGLVIFAGESFTQCPLTTDHTVLLNLLNKVEYHMIEDGTAIGNGLATAVSRLKDSQAKSKVIILLTDGTNNRGTVAPITAAEVAKTFGVRVYTIGAGTRGEAMYPMQNAFGRTELVPMKVDIDEPTLKQIAQTTGGVYFRATDNNSLESIYQEIDQMEKTKLSVQEYSQKEEQFELFALLALLFLLLDVTFRYTFLKSIP